MNRKVNPTSLERCPACNEVDFPDELFGETPRGVLIVHQNCHNCMVYWRKRYATTSEKETHRLQHYYIEKRKATKWLIT